MKNFKDYIEEKFLQDLLTPDEFRRELEQEIEDAGYSPNVIKKISKKRKGYEVKVSSYMGSLRDIFTDMGATKINFRKGGGVNTIMVEGKGLWANIHAKRKRGERMRKKGEKGAPTAAAMKAAQKASEASDFKLTPAREKELEKLAKDLPDKDFKARYGKDWKSVKIATAMNMLKKKYGFKEGTGKRKGESWEDGYKRRVVKATKPEHKDKGINWRIKGKERDEISIKLYKTKPSYAEFVKQMKRVAGHEFGG
jgi:hypothetical protein